MSSDDVTSAIKKLKPGKSDGYDVLSSDYYCNGTPLSSPYISTLYNCMITHCYAPNSFCLSTNIPIPKGSNKSTSTLKYKEVHVLHLAVYSRKYCTTTSFRVKNLVYLLMIYNFI